MRVIIQRVSEASVRIENKIFSKIKYGLVILLGIEIGDNQKDIDWLCGKIIGLRIFDDEFGIMNKSILELSLDVLVVSQFTLHASTKKGNRPSYIRAAKPQEAEPLYETFKSVLGKLLQKKIASGKFGAMMKISLINDGPVTIIIDSKNRE